MTDEKTSGEKKLYKAGDLAERAGVSRQAVHTYTVMGLIREAARTEGGHRLYDDRALRRVRLIEMMKREYPLGEILRTFRRGFSALLVAVVLVLPAVRAAPSARAAEAPGAPGLSAAPAAAGEGRFTKDEGDGIKALFGQLGRAMEKGDAHEVMALVSSRLKGAEREELARALAAEFEEYVYVANEYTIRYDLEGDGERRDGDAVEIAAVRITAPYRSRRKGIDATASTFDRSFTFLLVREDGVWRFGASRFWKEFNRHTARSVLGWIISGVLAGLLGVTFWLWMLFDCTFRAMRRGKAAWILAAVAPAPLGLALGVAFGPLTGASAGLGAGIAVSAAYMAGVWIPTRRSAEE